MTCANCLLGPFVNQCLGHLLMKLKDLVPALGYLFGLCCEEIGIVRNKLSRWQGINTLNAEPTRQEQNHIEKEFRIKFHRHIIIVIAC